MKYEKIILILYFRKRVCPQHKTIHVPYKATEVYTKPTIKHYTEPCNGQQICTGVR